MMIKKNTYGNSLYWLGILTLLLAEFILFRRYVLREIAPYFPPNFDQAGFLTVAYTLYQAIPTQGLASVLHTGLLAQAISCIFIPQTLLAFLFFGASRLSALSLNFLYFALLQLFLVKTTLDVTGKRLFASMILGLILLAPTPFFWAGGIFDFRIDFMVFCLYGIFVASLIQSQIFLDRKWTLIASLIGIYLILLRFITVIYIGGVVAATFGYFLLLLKYQKKQAMENKTTQKRLFNIIFFCLILLIVAAPFLWMDRSAIYNYYVVHHVLDGESSMRSLQFGVTNLFTSLTYYPNSIYTGHLGSVIPIIMLTLFLCASLIYLYRRDKFGRTPANPNTHTLVFLVFAIIIPILALTSDPSKSPVVGNVTIAPLLLLAVWSLYFIYQKSHQARSLLILMMAGSLVVFSLGIRNFIHHFSHHSKRIERTSLEQLNNMYVDIGNYMQDKGVKTIHYSTDQIIGFSTFTALSSVYYEKKHILLHIAPLMSTSMNELNEDEIKSALNQSDVFIVNLKPYPEYAGNYPFNLSMKRYHSFMQELAEKDFMVLGEYHYNDFYLRVYVKSHPQIS